MPMTEEKEARWARKSKMEREMVNEAISICHMHSTQKFLVITPFTEYLRSFLKNWRHVLTMKGRELWNMLAIMPRHRRSNRMKPLSEQTV
jgi:hypothetical protein